METELAKLKAEKREIEKTVQDALANRKPD
jgi:hypothetical protein